MPSGFEQSSGQRQFRDYYYFVILVVSDTIKESIL